MGSLPITVLGVIAACGGSDFSGASTPDAGPTTVDDAAQPAPPADNDAAPPSADAGSPQADATGPEADSDTADTAPPAPSAVFVSSSTGASDGLGSPDRPLASLQVAIDTAATRHTYVIACAETFAEALTLKDGVSILGNYTCTGGAWAPGSVRATVKAPSIPAVQANGIASETHLTSLEITAPDATGASASSIAMIATSSPGLYLSDVLLNAGQGTAGTDGTAPVQLTQTGYIDGSANWAPSTCSGSAGMTLCLAEHQTTPGGTSVCSGASGFDGGAGGNGGNGGRYQRIFDSSTVPPSYWTTLNPPTNGNTASASTAAGGLAGYPFTPAQAGAIGADGANGASAAGIGVIAPTGYTPASGTTGANGAPGQGGGAGAGRMPSAATASNFSIGDIVYGSAGASGGAGGCPGLAGTAGAGGGASIALLATDSPMHVDKSTFTSSAAGNGGRGTLASNPTGGGAAGPDSAGVDGYAGAAGGPGGKGGNSGSGAGGPSIAMAYRGTRPTTTNTTLTPGAGGHGVAAIAHPDGRVISASPDGVSQGDYSF